MRELFTALLLVVGSGFMFLAALGVWRMPDLYTRMQAAAKAGTLGKACLMAAAIVYFGDLGFSTRAMLVIGFFFLTAPVAAHRIGRAAYAAGVPLWEKSVVDEMRGIDADAGVAPHHDTGSGSAVSPPAGPA